MTTKTVLCENLLFHGGLSYRCHRTAGTKTGRFDRPACNICAAAYKRGQKRTIQTMARWGAESASRKKAKAERDHKADAFDALLEAAGDVLDVCEGSWSKPTEQLKRLFPRLGKLRAAIKQAEGGAS